MKNDGLTVMNEFLKFLFDFAMKTDLNFTVLYCSKEDFPGKNWVLSVCSRSCVISCVVG